MPTLLTGRVIDNDDPLRLGRVRVLAGSREDKFETDWLPLYTLGSGIFNVPEINRYVVLEFLDNDPDRGYVTATTPYMIPEGSSEPEICDEDKSSIYLMKLTDGTSMVFDDRNGAGNIYVKYPDGESADIKNSGGKVHISADKKMNLIINGIKVTDKDNMHFKNGKISKIEGKLLN